MTMVNAPAPPSHDIDILRLLVQQVARSFYDAKFVIIMDQLARSQVIKDDDLASRMGIQAKELNKLTAVLVNHKLVKVYRRNELKEGASRAVGRQYYYIDYKHFCDVVKWRVAEMWRLIDKDLRNELDTKGYICPQCETSFTPLDVDRLVDPASNSFLCEICRTELIDNEKAENVLGSQDRMQSYNRQMACIREGLRKSEEMVLPAFDVEAWVRANTTEAEKEVIENGDGLKIAGGRHGGTENEVGVVLSMGKDEAARRAERERVAEEKRAQNQMPSWHLKSTISGDLTALGIAQATREAEQQQSVHILETLSGIPSKSLSSNNLSTLPMDGLPPKGISSIDIKPAIDHQAAYYDQYYATLEAGPSRTRSEADSYDNSEEEDVKPHIHQLESLRTSTSNVSLKRSRSRSREADDRGSKFLRTPSGAAPSRNGSMGASLPPTTGLNTPEDIDMKATNESGDDPIVYVNGQAIAFSKVTDEDHELMTPDEYGAYFNILQEKGL